jgi:hypothetical protein
MVLASQILLTGLSVGLLAFGAFNCLTFWPQIQPFLVLKSFYCYSLLSLPFIVWMGWESENNVHGRLLLSLATSNLEASYTIAITFSFLRLARKLHLAALHSDASSFETHDRAASKTTKLVLVTVLLLFNSTYLGSIVYFVVRPTNNLDVFIRLSFWCWIVESVAILTLVVSMAYLIHCLHKLLPR